MPPLLVPSSSSSSMRDRVAVVTGANCGLGFHTAEALVGRGAIVVLACRSHSVERIEMSR